MATKRGYRMMTERLDLGAELADADTRRSSLIARARVMWWTGAATATGMGKDGHEEELPQDTEAPE